MQMQILNVICFPQTEKVLIQTSVTVTIYKTLHDRKIEVLFWNKWKKKTGKELYKYRWWQ